MNNKLFNQADYVAARTAARIMPATASNENVGLIMQQSQVPLLIYFLAHISEQRRRVRISSFFYYDSLRRETERRCIVFGDKKDEVVKEIMELAMAKAHALWTPSHERENYNPPLYVREALVEFLQKQS